MFRVRPLNIVKAIQSKGPLHVSVVGSRADEASMIGALGHNHPSAADAVSDLHSVDVNGTNTAVRAVCGGSGIFQRDLRESAVRTEVELSAIVISNGLTAVGMNCHLPFG